MSDVSPSSPVLVTIDIMLPRNPSYWPGIKQNGESARRRFAVSNFLLPVGPGLDLHLPDRRRHFGFVYCRSADRFAFLDEPYFAVLRESRSSRNQVTHDHVLFESTETIDFAERRSFGEHASRVLERCRRNKAVGFERSFGDAEQYWHRFSRLAAF